MSEAHENKYFYCQPCKYAWETDEYVDGGDKLLAVCPVCERPDAVVESSHRVFNLMKAWSQSTGPKTKDGKARSALNPWKTGRFASQLNMMAPAKPGELPACASCTILDQCKDENFKYCPVDLETVATFIHAYKEQQVNDLRDIAGMSQAQLYRIFQNMIAFTLDKGVMLLNEKKIVDKDGNVVLDDAGKPMVNQWWAKNDLLNDIPKFAQAMGQTAELQDMTPKTRQETETLKGFIDDKEKDRETELDMRKKTLEEQTKLRKAIASLNAVTTVKKFQDEAELINNEQSADPAGKPGGEGNTSL